MPYEIMTTQPYIAYAVGTTAAAYGVFTATTFTTAATPPSLLPTVDTIIMKFIAPSQGMITEFGIARITTDVAGAAPVLSLYHSGTTSTGATYTSAATGALLVGTCTIPVTAKIADSVLRSGGGATPLANLDFNIGDEIIMTVSTVANVTAGNGVPTVHWAPYRVGAGASAGSITKPVTGGLGVLRYVTS